MIGEFSQITDKNIAALVFVFVFLMLGANSKVEAATINAVSCSQADVQAAIDVASDGDMILLPSGNCTWNSHIDWTKGGTIQGSGESVLSGTVITANNSLIFHLTADGGNFRLTNLRLQGTGGSEGLIDNSLLAFGGSSLDGLTGGSWNSLRVDHLTIHYNYGGYSINLGPWYTFTSSPKALFDHITYISSGTAGFMKMWGNNNSWKEDDNFGTDDFIFIEDSSFSWTNTTSPITDTECGVRFIFRHNMVSGGQVQMHDTGSTQGCRGNRAVEVYDNDFSNCTVGQCSNWPAIGVRGGTGLVYNNTIGSGYWIRLAQQVWSGYGGVSGVCNNVDKLRWDEIPGRGVLGCCDSKSERICSTLMGHCIDAANFGNPCYQEWDCDGVKGHCAFSCTTNAECNPGGSGYNTCLFKMDNVNDGNDPSGWPCRDQNGRGEDSADGATQAMSPIYAWNNQDENGNEVIFDENYYNDNFLKPNRDYYNCENLADAKLKGLNVNYSSYIYPHPLQNESGSDTTFPANPENLSVR